MPLEDIDKLEQTVKEMEMEMETFNVLYYEPFSDDNMHITAQETFNLFSNRQKFKSAMFAYREEFLQTFASTFYNASIGSVIADHVTRTKQDADAVIEILKRTIGQKLDTTGNGNFCYTSERLPLNIKQVGNKFKLNKLKNWSIIAEQLKQIGCLDVKFYTSYPDLKKYYTLESCSGGSCMRHSFPSVPLHPCIAYAHDAKHYADALGLEGVFNVSSDIKLAVLFDNNRPVARCMVSGDGVNKQRGKAQGSRASELVKVLDRLGYDDDGIYGHINLIMYDGDKYIVPYVDGCDSVDTDGELHTGSINTTETCGYASEGVWSEYHEESLPENEAIWSNHHDSYIRADESVCIGNEYYHQDSDDIVYSDHHNEHLFIDDAVWSEFLQDYLLIDQAESILIELIEEKLPRLDFADLDKIAEDYI